MSGSVVYTAGSIPVAASHLSFLFRSLFLQQKWWCVLSRVESKFKNCCPSKILCLRFSTELSFLPSIPSFFPLAGRISQWKDWLSRVNMILSPDTTYHWHLSKAVGRHCFPSCLENPFAHVMVSSNTSHDSFNSHLAVSEDRNSLLTTQTMLAVLVSYQDIMMNVEFFLIKCMIIKSVLNIISKNNWSLF